MISVIIPTYKAPEALDICLQSAIYNQTNQNEIIVVVDGFYNLNKDVLEKHKDSKLDNLNVIEQLSEDVLDILTLCGLKFYGKGKQNVDK